MSALDEAKNAKRKSRKRSQWYEDSLPDLQRTLRELRSKLTEPNNDIGRISEDKQKRKVTTQMAAELRGQLMRMMEQNTSTDFGAVAREYAQKHNVDEEELFQAVAALMGMAESKITESLNAALTEAKKPTAAQAKQCHSMYMDALSQDDEADLESIVQDCAEAMSVDADYLHDSVLKLMKKHEAKNGPSATVKFFYAKKFMGQTGPFLRTAGMAGIGENAIMGAAAKVYPDVVKLSAAIDAKKFNETIDKIEAALKKVPGVKVTKGKCMYAPEFHELDAQWVGEDEPMKESADRSRVNELTEQLHTIKRRLDESLIDKLEKFAGSAMKPGRNVINGYPVDIEDSDGSYIVMKPVDKDATTGLVKALRKAGFKAKADKQGEITIDE